MSYPGQSISERAEMLEETKWGLEFDWKDLMELAKYLKVTRTIKGMTVFHEGDRDAYMCVLVEGKVDIVKEDKDLKRKLIARVGKGKAFGEMSLIDGGMRSAAAMAIEDSIMLVLTKEEFDRLQHENSILGIKLAMKIAKLMSQRLRLTSGILVDYLSRTHD